MTAVLTQKEVAMVLTLVPVGPRQKKLNEQWFALQVALAYEGESTNEEIAAAELLPWANHFKFGDEDVTVLLHENGAVNDDSAPTILKAKLAAVDAGTVGNATNKKIPLLKNDASLNAAKNWLDGAKCIIEWSPKSISSSSATENSERLMEKMAFLSTFPGAVPQELGLVHYFKIESDVAIDTGKSYQLIATLGSANHAELKPSPTEFKFWKASAAAGGAPEWTSGWPYKDKKVKSYVKPLSLSLGTNSKLNFDNEPVSSTSLGPSFEDYWVRLKPEKPWAERIDEICAAFANFPSLIHRLYGLEKIETANRPAWDALLSVAARRFARWGDPTKADGDLSVKTAQLLSRLEQDNLFNAAARTEFAKRLSTFRADLLLLPDETGEHAWRQFLEKLCTSQKLLPAKKDDGGSRPSLSELAALISDNPSGVLEDFLSLQITYGVCFHKQAGQSDEFAKTWLEMTGKSEYKKRLSDPEGFATQGQVKYGGYQFECRTYTNGLRDKICATVGSAKELKDLLSAELSLDNGSLIVPLMEDIAPRLVDPALFKDANWRKDWNQRVEEFVLRLVDGPVCENKPGGLTVQLDKSAMVIKSGPGSVTPLADTDAWRKLSGFGLLVRDLNTAKKTWHLVSAAGLSCIEKSVDNQEKVFPLLNGPSPVPLRIPYKDGLRFPFVTYNQNSLISGSALINALDDQFEASDGDDSGATYVYDPVTTGPDSMKLARLKFGHRYELAGFLIDTAGGLPTDLHGACPWQFKVNFALNGVPGKTEIPYWRRVAVGQVRIGAAKLDLKKEELASFWPTVPDDVAPLAREITRGERVTYSKVTVPGADENEPIALLLDAVNPFEFGVRAPAVDIDVIERWFEDSAEVGKDQNGNKHKDDLKDLWKQHLLFVRDSQPGVSDDVNKRGDVSMDDPAVSDILVIYDRYDWVERCWVAVGAAVLDVSMDKRPGVGLAKYRSQPWKVSCKRGAKTWLLGKVDENKRSIEVVVPSDVSNVGRLKFCALVPKKYVEGGGGGVQERIASELISESGDRYDYQLDYVKALPAEVKSVLDAAVKDHHYLAPQTVLLETPTDLMPSSEEVWKHLTLKTLGQEIVDVNFVDPGYVGAVPAGGEDVAWRDQEWRNVWKAEVVRQSWRWQGRPIRPVPLTGDSTFWREARVVDEGLWNSNKEAEIRKLLEWEVESFVDLHDRFDSLFLPAAINVVARTKGDLQRLYRDDLQRERKSQYLRYGLRVYSRYGTLFSAVPVEGRQVFRGPANVEKWSVSGQGWRRAFVPFRGIRPKAPVLRAVVPLTESVGTGGGGDVASLLAVFDEAAFASCGISESMRVSVAYDERRKLYQYGRDPIVSGADDGPATVVVPDRALEGPFGYTYDTGARQPLYSSCSYVINPPENAQPWDFAKVMFRRLSGMETPEEEIESARLYTKPQWVQFLPSSSFGLKFDEAKIDSRGLLLSVPALQGVKPNPSIEDGDIKLSDLWIIITEKIIDFVGQGGSEKYVGVRKVESSDNDGMFKFDFGSTGIAMTDKILFRLVERQRSRLHIEDPLLGANWDENNFWQSVLGAEDQDCSARIVRISRPFTPVRLAP